MKKLFVTIRKMKNSLLVLCLLTSWLYTVYLLPSSSSIGSNEITFSSSTLQVYLDPLNYIFDTSTSSIGTLFNVTVKIKDANNMTAWQVKIFYNDTIINVTRWYEPTWDPTYVFYGKTTLSAPAPPNVNYLHENSNNGSATVAAILIPPGQMPFTGDGLLCILTFTITTIPSKSQIYTSELDFSEKGTYWFNETAGEKKYFDTYTNGYYELAWKQPPNPKLAVDPAYQEFGPFPPSAVGMTFNERVLIRSLDPAWALTNVTFHLQFNTTLINVTDWSVDPLWQNWLVTVIHASPWDEIDVVVWDPAANPSGDVSTITIEFTVMYQGSFPSCDETPLFFCYSQLMNHVIEIPTDPPIEGRIVIEGLVEPPLPWLEVTDPEDGDHDIIIADPDPLGREFEVNVVVKNLHWAWHMVGYQFRLTYNDTLLQGVSITEGQFLKDLRWNLYGTFFYSQFDPYTPPYPPCAIIGGLLLPNPESGQYDQTQFPNAPGPDIADLVPPVDPVLATIRFSVKKTVWNVKLNLELCSVDGHQLLDKYGNDIPCKDNINGTVTILGQPIHDVAITNVRVSNDFVYSGENISISVDAWNRGAFPETFNVTTYADKDPIVIGDEIAIATQSLSLPSEGCDTITFTWNTTGTVPGNYTISAVASSIPQEVDLTDNICINGKIGIFASIPCYDINITSPTYIELNPAIFQFNWTLSALEVSLGNMTIDSTGYEGLLRVLGSANGTVHLHVNQPNLEFADYYIPQNDSIHVPLWLLFDPGTYSGTYELQLTVCGTHRLKITVNIVHIWVCQNGAYSVAGGTATFNWTVTGGSWIYLEAQPNLPSGWSFTVDPPIGTLFETPHQIIVNITASPDAKEGDIGSVTIRAYKNGTNILIWHYTFFASVDNNPPIIETIQQPKLTLTGDLLFNATVKDTSGIEDVQLYYSVNNGPWNNQSMQWASGDTFNSTSYMSVVPHVPDDSTIQYYVVATDWLRNQTQSDTQTMAVKYDLAITEVRTLKTVLAEGFVTQINVTVANQGTIPNTSLKIAVYANTTLIHTQTAMSLTNGTTTTLIFYWNTTGFAKGNYTITAYVLPVSGETETIDNTLSEGWIIVAMAGDITGPDGYPDGACEMRDIRFVAKRFGVDPSNVILWDPNADVIEDNFIDMKDIRAVAKHFGEIDP